MSRDETALTPDEKYERNFARWYAAEEVDFVDPAAKEKYQASLTRVKDAIALRIPDRIPYIPLLQMYPYLNNGLDVEVAMYNYEKVREVWKKTVIEIDPDLYMNPILSYPGRAFEAFQYRLMKWPRNGGRSDQIYQFVEGEYMTADEYDEFLFDPTDFLLRKYYPRVYGIFEPMAALPPFHNGIWLGMLGWIAGFSAPGMGESFEKLVNAGKEMMAWFEHLAACDAEIKPMGYPNVVGGITFAPFDLVGDTLRGTRGVMLDMHRCPDKLLAAIEKMTRIAIRMGIDSAKAANNPMVWMYLHKGAAGFMSGDHFNTFYWPSLRELLLALIDEGLTPCVYSEGDYTPRLEAIANVSRGKVAYHFETVDYHKAKDVLGDVACIMGSVPLTILATGSADDVRDYCRMLIDDIGKGGGLIIDTDLVDEAISENIDCMGPFVKEHGIYS